MWSRCSYVDVVPALWLPARVSLLQDGGSDSAGNSSSEALRRTPKHRQVTRNLPRPGEAVTFTPKICVACWCGGRGQPYYILEVEQGRLMGKLEARRSGSSSCSVPINMRPIFHTKHVFTSSCANIRFVSLNRNGPDFSRALPAAHANQIKCAHVLRPEPSLVIGKVWPAVCRFISPAPPSAGAPL